MAFIVVDAFVVLFVSGFLGFTVLYLFTGVTELLVVVVFIVKSKWELSATVISSERIKLIEHRKS